MQVRSSRSIERRFGCEVSVGIFCLANSFWLISLVAAALVVLIGDANAAEEKSPATLPLARKIENFNLPDFRGHMHSLAQHSQSQLVAVAFVGVECPLAKLYAPRLEALAKEYTPRGVTFLAIDSNQQDNMTELAAFARLHELSFPVLKDAGNLIADIFAAERTPEVFVLDAARVIRYRGRIDDQYGFGSSGAGYQRDEPTRRDLAAALDDLLAGRAVALPITEPSGCLIGRLRPPQSNSAVTYAGQIADVLNRNCIGCHRPGQIAPFSLTSYEDAVGWSEMIGEVVAHRRMPPWHADAEYGHFSNEARLSDQEIALVTDWVAAGAPQGDASQTPLTPQFTPG